MIKKYSGTGLIVLLSLIPVAMWLLMKPISIRFGGPVLFFSSLGQLAGLIGMVLFSVNIIISTRLQIFEKIFGGLGRIYVIHHVLGATAFIFLLIHPLFLLARTLPISLAASSRFLLPEGYLAKDLGVYSLGFMIVLLILTFFVGMKYEVWKNSHKFLGAVFFLGAFHSFMIPTDISQNIFLKYYMIAIVSLGGAAYIYRTILGKWTTQIFTYEVIGKETPMDGIVELTFKAKEEIMSYEAGQFVFISFSSKYLPREIHPFSISSGDWGDTFRLTIKILGDYTNALQNAKIGDLAVVEGPFGRFNFKNFNNKNQVWIGGGVGITPFMGMAEDFAKDNEEYGYNVDFYYCTRDESEQTIIKDLMEKIKDKKDFSFIPHCSKNQGRISLDFISKNTKDFKKRDFLMCGPPAMMQSLRSQLRAAGVPNRKIHIEGFNF